MDHLSRFVSSPGVYAVSLDTGTMLRDKENERISHPAHFG
jgi:hypothetical protein